MQTEKQIIGAWGENEAVSYLRKKGYTVFERNFRTRAGELDIIAWHEKKHFGKTLVFVEVKTRSYGEGSAERATNYQKLSNLFLAARTFCLIKKISLDITPIQFEQVSIYRKNEVVDRIYHNIIPVD